MLKMLGGSKSKSSKKSGSNSKKHKSKSSDKKRSREDKTSAFSIVEEAIHHSPQKPQVNYNYKHLTEPMLSPLNPQ